MIEDVCGALSETLIDVAFLDIEMRGMSGLTMAKHLKQLRQETNIVLVTAYAEYALEAWKLYVSGYLLKPASAADVSKALSHLRIPLPQAEPQPKLLRVQCFGSFEVFCGSERVHFERSRAKELLAYLVSRRGASVSTGEICSVLWEDDNDLSRKKSLIRTCLVCLRKALRQFGLEEAVQHTRDAYSVNTALLDCDYYRFLELDPVALNSYQSEFMRQYSWAEPLIFPLEQLREKAAHDKPV